MLAWGTGGSDTHTPSPGLGCPARQWPGAEEPADQLEEAVQGGRPSRVALHADPRPQGDRCVMGQQRSFRRRKPTSWCIKGRSFTAALAARVCQCRASDFLW